MNQRTNNSKSEMVADLKLLIDLSCAPVSKLHFFEQFHHMIIRLACEASDISIDYRRNRIYMNIPVANRKGDFLYNFDQGVPNRTLVNLRYSKLDDFLKGCLHEGEESYSLFYQDLISKFLKGKTKLSATEALDIVKL